MDRPSAAFAIVVAALVAVPSTGSAQLSGREHRASRADVARATILFERSAVAYGEQRYDVASALLLEAYSLSGEPILLHNLGRAREGAGDRPGAIAAYRRFVELAPEDARAASARDRIAAIEEALAEEARAEEARLAEEARAEEARAEEARLAEAARAEEARRADEEARARALAEERRRGEPGAWPWVLVGVGAAGIAAGTVVAVLAVDTREQAAAAHTQVDASRLAWEANDLAIGADVAFAVGGALLGVGVVWLLVDASRSGRGSTGDVPSARLSIGPGTVSLRVAF